MKKRITIKIKGHNVILKHNNLTDIEISEILNKQMTYLQRSTSRRRVFRSTRIRLKTKAFGKRVGYVMKALRIACSPKFSEINRRQDTSRALFMNSNKKTARAK